MDPQKPIILSKEEVLRFLSESRESAKRGASTVVGHSVIFTAEMVENHVDIGKWAVTLDLPVEFLTDRTIIEIVPLGFRKDIFPDTV